MLKKFLSQGEANIKSVLIGSMLFGLAVGAIDWRLSLGWFWAFVLLIPILTVDLVSSSQDNKIHWQASVYRFLSLLGSFGLALDGGTAVVAPSFGLYLVGLSMYAMSVRTDGRLFMGKYFVWPFEAMLSAFGALDRLDGIIKPMLPKKSSFAMSDKSKSVIRGVVIAAPILLVFGLLLSSSDPIFARLFDLPFSLPELNLSSLLRFMFTLFVFTGLALGFTSIALKQKRPELTIVDSTKFGLMESKIIGWSMAALFGLFIIVQFRYMFMGYKDVVEGYTYSDYARRGFVELIIVSLSSLAIMRYFYTKLGEGAKQLKILSLLLVVQMLVMAASSLKRLSLYEQAYGLTTLRLFAFVTVVWLAGVWLISAAMTLGNLKDRQISGYAAAWLALVAGVYLLISPSQFVIAHNFERYRDTGKLDGCYQKQLARETASAYVSLLDEAAKSNLQLSKLDDFGQEVRQPMGGPNEFNGYSANCSVSVMDYDDKSKLADGYYAVNNGFNEARNNIFLEHTLRSYLAAH